MLTLNEDLFDDLPVALPEEPITVSTEVVEEPTEGEVYNGVASMLITAINDEWETIKLYGDIIVNLTAEGMDDIIPIIQDILDEENIHVGQLQSALELVSPSTSKIEDGEEEAEDQMVELTETLNKNVNNASEDEEVIEKEIPEEIKEIIDPEIRADVDPVLGAEKQPVPEEPELPSILLDESLFEDVSTDLPAGADLFAKVYAELQSYHGYGEIPAEITTDAEGKTPKRYEPDHLGVNPANNAITVTVPTKDRLKFAQEVAEHFNVPYKYITGENSFTIEIKIPEDETVISDLGIKSLNDIRKEAEALGKAEFEAGVDLRKSAKLRDYIKTNKLVKSKAEEAVKAFRNGYVRAKMFSQRNK